MLCDFFCKVLRPFNPVYRLHVTSCVHTVGTMTHAIYSCCTYGVHICSHILRPTLTTRASRRNQMAWAKTQTWTKLQSLTVQRLCHRLFGRCPARNMLLSTYRLLRNRNATLCLIERFCTFLHAAETPSAIFCGCIFTYTWINFMITPKLEHSSVIASAIVANIYARLFMVFGCKLHFFLYSITLLKYFSGCFRTCQWYVFLR